MPKFNEVLHVKNISLKSDFIFVGDIGGTNSRFAVFTKTRLILSLIIPSKTIKKFATTVNQILDYIEDKYKIKVTKACFAVAGKVSEKRDFSEVTNLKINLDAKEIIKKTALKSVKIINDFEAIGYGLQMLDKKSLIKINPKTKEVKNKTKVILGAGTGLGKSILIWDERCKTYLPVASEGGHSDFAPQNQEELDLVNFLKEKVIKTKNNIEWEDLVSGSGIANIYKFLQNTKKYKNTKYFAEIKKNKYSSELISKYRTKDKLCKDTFTLFTRFYARAAKNFALETLAVGGVYIYGKIAIENSEIFKTKTFLNEFVKSRKLNEVLTKIPVFLIKDFNVGLYGAAIF